VRDFGSPEAVTDPDAYDPTAGLALRERLLDPLSAALSGRTRLIVAPDSTLSLVPFDALPLDGERCAIDEYQVSYVSTGRDLLNGAHHPPTRGHPVPADPVVVADPDFDLAEAPIPSRARGRPFRRLAGSAEEGALVADRLGVSGWFGPDAVKERGEELRSPRILHLATHGFFFGAAGVKYSEAGDSLTHPLADGVDRLATLANPALRSGVALAGANAWVQDRAHAPQAGNGVMTAEEISGLDLIDTELVVLSACDTGVGDVQVGEGVFGLRRAFTISGARNLVMSLWRISDATPVDLMDEFYRQLSEGSDCRSALHAAQLQIRRTYPHPRDWAAFIFAGPGGTIETSPKDNLGANH
jgi:CHAT domain-containing protein